MMIQSNIFTNQTDFEEGKMRVFKDFIWVV